MTLAGRLWVCLALAGCARASAEPSSACEANESYDTARARTGRFFHAKLRGETAAAVRERLGEPGCQSAALWRYWIPRGCSYEKTVVSLWFRKGRVTKVRAVDIITGAFCE
ncbi:MAG: hypothetical protein R3B48_01715 [Kofleriaceae bacterium]